MAEKSKNNIEPKFCFLCGSKLEKLNNSWYQCENDQCNEIFFSYKDQNERLIVNAPNAFKSW